MTRERLNNLLEVWEKNKKFCEIADCLTHQDMDDLITALEDAWDDIEFLKEQVEHLQYDLRKGVKA